MPDPGLPPPTRPSQIVLDKWLHDFWSWVRTFVQRVVAADTSMTVTTKNGVVSLSAHAATPDASYATVANESTDLPSSRQLVAGANVTLTDGGPGSTLSIAASGGSVSPLTTKGDIWGFDTTDNRIPVGSDGKVLTADSSAALGVSYQTPASGAPVNAKYVVVALDGTLTDERVITAGTHISLTDGGAGGALTIATTGLTASPLTTKGDVWGFSSVDARVAVGSDGQVLTADSAQTLGVKWATTLSSPLTTKGDLWGFSSVDARLPVGSNGQFLTADSTQTLGVKWAAVSASAMVALASVVTSSSATSVTFSSISGAYKHLKIFVQARYNSNAINSTQAYIQFNGDATAANYTGAQNAGAANGIAVVNVVASATLGGAGLLISGTAASAAAVETAEVTIIGYTNTVFQKTCNSFFGGQDGGFTRAQNRSFTWASTAAINSIVINAIAGQSFLDGSTFDLYGIA